MTRIKICGITNKADAISAVSLGVDMLGFVFYKRSARYVTPEAAAIIVNELPPYVGKVGVFVSEKAEDVLETARIAGLDMLQLHGDETPEYCEGFRGSYRVIKAFRIKDANNLILLRKPNGTIRFASQEYSHRNNSSEAKEPFSIAYAKENKRVNGYGADFYLFDTYKGDSIGGTGETFDWKVLKYFEILKPVILSGGLNPQNVEDAIKEVLPYGVDVSTGVERSPGKKDPELMKRFVENVRKVDR